MNSPNWISRKEVETLHQGVIEIGGGASGLGDQALLDSALARPQNQYSYGKTDIFYLAAVHAEAISRNHAFVDGNKRTAFMVAVNFLELNGYTLQPAKGSEHADLMESLTQGKINCKQVATHLRAHSQAVCQGTSE